MCFRTCSDSDNYWSWVWIGGYKNDNGEWAWSDKSVYSYSDWASSDEGNGDYIAFGSYYQDGWVNYKHTGIVDTSCSHDCHIFILDEIDGSSNNEPFKTGYICQFSSMKGNKTKRS